MLPNGIFFDTLSDDYCLRTFIGALGTPTRFNTSRATLRRSSGPPSSRASSSRAGAAPARWAGANAGPDGRRAGGSVPHSTPWRGPRVRAEASATPVRASSGGRTTSPGSGPATGASGCAPTTLKGRTGGYNTPSQARSGATSNGHRVESGR